MPSSISRFLVRDILPALIILAAGTVLFRIFNWDLPLAHWAQDDNGEWTNGASGIWHTLYVVGTVPALAAGFTAIVALIAGLRRRRFARIRKPSAYVLLVLLVGPLLIANAALKEHWGRPRPRDVIPLGGEYAFEEILTIDPTSPGKSFPCGHATMGFFFFAGYFLLRSRRPALAHGFLLLSLGFGTIIGIARLLQGGHFASDTLWAAGVLWFTCAFLARWMKIDQPLPEIDEESFTPLSWPKLSLFCLALPALVFSGLLASPIGTSESFALSREHVDSATKLVIKSPNATLHIRPGDAFTIERKSHGHGLPGSGMKSVWNEKKKDDGRVVAEFKQRKSGLATELHQTIDARFIAEHTQELSVELDEGKITLTIPEATDGLVEPPVTLRLKTGPDVAIKIIAADGAEFSVKDATGRRTHGTSKAPWQVIVPNGAMVSY